MKQDALDSYEAATNAYVKTENAKPLPERVKSALQGLDLARTPKCILPFASIDKPISTSSK